MQAYRPGATLGHRLRDDPHLVSLVIDEASSVKPRLDQNQCPYSKVIHVLPVGWSGLTLIDRSRHDKASVK